MYNWNGNCLRAFTEQLIHTWTYIDLLCTWSESKADSSPAWEMCDDREKDGNCRLFFAQEISLQHIERTVAPWRWTRFNASYRFSCAARWWRAEEVGRWFQGHVSRYSIQFCSDIVYHSSQIFKFRENCDRRTRSWQIWHIDTTEIETRSRLNRLNLFAASSTKHGWVCSQLREIMRGREREE